ncbi:hypothetical protein [Fibrobacter sp. UWB12]|uniref:hypothetical protein n=1 Tax=Fibrobacter sp. UWB12 TaxID=1896203 RepID=UPI00091F9E88|nr:hypothetical protein [Fibrobacter sp. UWB12]SHK43181.1 hypothetical protein SAMN05720759_102456 [Fibrobacter sp. UWB12]
MKRAKKFPKASILGVAAVSTLFTACDLIHDLIPADPNPGDPHVQISSSSHFVPASSSAILPTSSFNQPSAFQTWRGPDGYQRIETGHSTDTETAGYWYSFADDVDGGMSRVVWPVPEGDEYDSGSLQPIVDYCKGLCGTASLNKGTMTYNPFAGVAFNLAGEDSRGNIVAADVSDMDGVCISYASEAIMSIEMIFDDATNSRIGYANPAVTIPKSLAGTTKTFSWSNFKQPSWYKGDYKISGTEGAKRLVALRFKLQASMGDYRFNITEIGKNGACTGVPANLDIIGPVDPIVIDPPDTIPPGPAPENNFETWFGYQGYAQINTGYDNGSLTSGYWFSYGDDVDGGQSRIVWPVPQGNEYSDDALDPIIEHCNGLCGTAVLDKGVLTYNPYVGVGFNLAGETKNGEADIVDASSIGGICISYTSTAAPTLEMGLGEALDAAIGYAQPAVALPKSTVGVTKFIPWSNFKQPSWYKGDLQLTGEQAAKHLANIKFKIQAHPGEYDFNIQAVGPFNGGTCAPNANVLP